jgi:hypothetical protein
MNAKHLTVSVLVLTSVSILFAGCDRPAETTQVPARVEVQPPAIVESPDSFGFSNRTNYAAAMREQLADINRDMDELEARIERSSDSVKVEAKSRLQLLRSKASQLGQSLDQAQEVTESSWDKFKSDAKATYGEVADGLTEARQWISDKIAP